jgi:hypothetical protein
LKPKFHPKFADLRTTRCPPGWASAVPIKTAKIKVRIKKKVAAELYFDFMAYGNPGFGFRQHGTR